MTTKCENCKHWDHQFIGECPMHSPAVFGQPPDINEACTGFCRRFPPTFNPLRDWADCPLSVDHWDWPTTKATDFCGEFLIRDPMNNETGKETP